MARYFIVQRIRASYSRNALKIVQLTSKITRKNLNENILALKTKEAL